MSRKRLDGSLLARVRAAATASASVAMSGRGLVTLTLGRPAPAKVLCMTANRRKSLLLRKARTKN